ncbi:hypothetical protein J3R82DRAFT_4861 [Butyriboletus roseoflavus]|nr:hypothetical protein J3R82DRAFT_4861 [Butyriboletus roseoflavus]
METVRALKKIIRVKKFVRFHDVEADKLQLYSILIPEDDDNRLKDQLKQLSLEDKLRLNSQTKVPNLPQSDKGQEVLNVIDRPHSSVLIKVFHCPFYNQLRLLGSSAIDPAVSRNLQLNCIVLGNDPCQSFIIRIAGMANVDDLKELIKQRKVNDFHNIDVNNLDLYEVSLPKDG